MFARANDDGGFRAASGKVEIRYKADDGRMYNANAGNLARVGTEVLPDDACGPAESAPKAQGKGGKGETARREAQKVSIPKVSAEFFIAYADGACSGNPGPAGLGVVVVAPDGKVAEGYEYLGSATNNVGELMAILRALEAVPRDAPLAVHTDSQYSIGVLTKGWKAKANQELILRVKAAIKAHAGPFSLIYVPGHAGVPLNERADELAREAVSTRGSRSLKAPG